MMECINIFFYQFESTYVRMLLNTDVNHFHKVYFLISDNNIVKRLGYNKILTLHSQFTKKKYKKIIAVCLAANFTV